VHSAADFGSGKNRRDRRSLLRANIPTRPNLGIWAKSLPKEGISRNFPPKERRYIHPVGSSERTVSGLCPPCTSGPALKWTLASGSRRLGGGEVFRRGKGRRQKLFVFCTIDDRHENRLTHRILDGGKKACLMQLLHSAFCLLTSAWRVATIRKGRKLS
jgi:hypothetical protein